MARLRYAESTDPAFESWLETWLTNMEPWEDENHTNELPTLTDPPEDSRDSYYGTDLRFQWSEDRAHILDNLDQYLASYAPWYRIGYHECTHDGTGGPCSWNVEPREGGTVPDYIPSMQPE